MFKQRSLSEEHMDSPAFDALLADQSFRFIERVNRFLGGARVVWRFVKEEASRLPPGEPLRVLDIGSGSCDIPIAVSHRAARAGIHVQFVCVERDPYAAARARRFLNAAGDLPITLVEGDIFEQAPTRPHHVAVGSMVFHHFTAEQIRELVGRLVPGMCERLLINDLIRSWPNYLGAHVLCLAETAGVRHDAVLSVRRGFRCRELRELLVSLQGLQVACDRVWPYRIRAVVEAQSGQVSARTTPVRTG